MAKTHRITQAQKRVLKALDNGATVIGWNDPTKGAAKEWSFTSDYDGIRATLYLTITARALIRAGICKVDTGSKGARLVRV